MGWAYGDDDIIICYRSHDLFCLSPLFASVSWLNSPTNEYPSDNNGPFQPDHFVPLFASMEKKEPVTFAEIVKHGSLKHPSKAEEAKEKSVHQRVS